MFAKFWRFLNMQQAVIKGFFSVGSGIGDLSVHEGLDFGNFLSSKDGIFPAKVGFPPL